MERKQEPAARAPGSGQDELDLLRREIDEADRQLLDLFLRRMELAGRVGEYKRRRDLPVLDRRREAQVLQQRAALAPEADREDVTAFFEELMALSRLRQQRLMASGETPWLARLRQSPPRDPLARPWVLYQGEPGAYAEQAAMDFFGEDCGRDRVDLWEDVFSALRAGDADYGVLPVENSSTGSINQVYDLLGKYGAYIVGEQTVRVEHCLLAPPGASLDGLREVFSHEQGLLQCAPFLKAHPGWTGTAVRNTAAAAALVAHRADPALAAIGSRRCAGLYGLEVLAEKINANQENFTRFIIVSPVLELRPGRDKVSALFTLNHESGALYRILAAFAHGGLNLMKLESRPIPGRSWEYRFFVDFSGDLSAPGMERTLRDAAEAAESFRILGNYPANT